MDPTNNIRLVLQGEIALIDGNKNPNVKILTSIPMTCTVFTLYDKASKVGALAHLDSYTHVGSIVMKIQKILDKNLGTTIDKYRFEAQVCGGLKEYTISQKQQESLLSILKLLDIPYQILELSEPQENRKQLQFDVFEGTLVEKALNEDALEYLQRRELADWEEAFKKGTFVPPISNEKEIDVRGLFSFKIREAKRDASILDILKQKEIFPSKKQEQVNEIYEKFNNSLKNKTNFQLNETEINILKAREEIELIAKTFLKPLRSPFLSGSWAAPLEEDEFDWSFSIDD